MDYRVTPNQVAQLKKHLVDSHECTIEEQGENHSIISDGDVTLDCTFAPADHGPGVLDVGVSKHPFWKSAHVIFNAIGPTITNQPDEPIAETLPPPPDEQGSTQKPADHPDPHPAPAQTVN